MLKIRRPLGRLIFNMGIAIPGKTIFLIETAPWRPHIDVIIVKLLTICLILTQQENPRQYVLRGWNLYFIPRCRNQGCITQMFLSPSAKFYKKKYCIDNCEAIKWTVISNSLDIDFNHGDIHCRSCKKLKLIQSIIIPYKSRRGIALQNI